MGERILAARRRGGARKGESPRKTIESVVSLPLSNRLGQLAMELESAHATCVTVQLVLLSQDADEDGQIETCLRTHVSNPLGHASEALREVSERLRLGDAS
jgi:hypothetical protein